MSITQHFNNPFFRKLRQFKHARLRPSRRILSRFKKHFPEATFVQIGSNDGQKHDPIHHSIVAGGWRGVLVEPVPYVFERLAANYANNDRVALANIAIADHESTQPFYYIAQANSDELGDLPRWYDELGSFNKDVVLKHVDQIRDLESRLRVMDVRCSTFDKLCCENDIPSPDLVHMDTEGFDFNIIKTIDFSRYLPALLIYEHKHLGVESQSACDALLKSCGYVCYRDGADTWCISGRRSDLAGKAFHASVIGSLRNSPV